METALSVDTSILLPSGPHGSLFSGMRVVAIDLEHNGKDPRCDRDFTLLGVSYANSEGMADYIPLGHYDVDANLPYEVGVSILRREVGQSTHIVFHNAKHDLVSLERGIGLSFWKVPWFDTLLMQQCVNENIPDKGLDALGQRYFGEGKEVSPDFERFLKAFGWAFVPSWMIRDYAIQDAKLTLKIFYKLWPDFVEQGYV